MNGKLIAALAAAWLAAGCVTTPPHPALTEQSLAAEASAGPMAIVDGSVITDNDAAFQSKLRLVEEARTSLDLSYYIYSDDESSSLLSEALIAAARRGVRVRLLTDYQTNYKRLDTFSALAQRGSTGKGSLEVRFYNRPTRHIVMDAAYMAMGCGEGAAPTAEDCSAQKFAALDKLFAEEKVDGLPAAPLNISDLNTGGSGLLLSGLYGKSSGLMTLAILHGQDIDPKALGGAGKATPEAREGLKKLGKLYWQSRTGSAFAAMQARLELVLAEQMYGSEILPLKNGLFSALPVNRKIGEEEKKDWEHFTDFTHQKLLLADAGRVQLGGRNVENSYHMHPNSLVEKYIFMDTDLVATLAGEAGGKLEQAFERLWNFKPMVATLDEVRAHAPNEMLENLEAYGRAEKACADIPQGAMYDSCVDGKYQLSARSLDQRIAEVNVRMSRAAERYRQTYAASIQPATGLPLDAGARLYYLENLPFDRSLPQADMKRFYGARAGAEGAGGKHIAQVWLDALSGICEGATPAAPRSVILHNAYFFPPANLAAALAQLVDGSRDCSGVTVRVLSNSLDTTDLAPVNFLARHAIKAFAEFAGAHKNGRSARFEYYEYQKPAEGFNLSLHSKVSLFGDRLVVGSANADVRSFMMDSNNAMLVDGAPELARAYRGFVAGLLAAPGRLKMENEYFAATPRAQMVQEDLARLHAILARYRADKHLKPEQLKDLDSRFVALLDAAYAMTQAAIAPDAGEASRRAAQDKFNELFQPI
ncbi:MAG: phospholipase D-like domain-containing protein [Rhodocyclaceae bacterium]|nr:phospholipase D-like domain-containing protein [Rhodocyclaceae bacterium]